MVETLTGAGSIPLRVIALLRSELPKLICWRKEELPPTPYSSVDLCEDLVYFTVFVRCLRYPGNGTWLADGGIPSGMGPGFMKIEPGACYIRLALRV